MIDGGELLRVLGGEQPPMPAAVESPVRAEIAAASERFLRPLEVSVAGRAGTGRDTVARALRERLDVRAFGPGEDAATRADADLDLYVLVGGVRPTDLEELSVRSPDRTIVVLGKADTLDDPHASSARAAEVLGTPVIALSALIACADVTDDEYRFLRGRADAGEQMPSMSARFLRGAPGSAERVMRRRLLQRLDRFGIDLALGLLAPDRQMADGETADGETADCETTDGETTDGETTGRAGDGEGIDGACALNAALHRLSGVEGLIPMISSRVDTVRQNRVADARTRLDELAAAGIGRDVIEWLLRMPAVAR